MFLHILKYICWLVELELNTFSSYITHLEGIGLQHLY